MKQITNQYDLTLKDILNGFEKSFIKRFLDLDIKSFEMINIELIKIEEKIADYICKIIDTDESEKILHIEFQSTNHETMHIRMIRYLIELYNKYNLPVIQVVLYIGKDKLRMKDNIRFKILDTRIDYQYKIINIKEIDYQTILNDNDLMVLSILCNFNGKDENLVIREILQKIEILNIGDELKKRNNLLKLEVLSKLRDLDYKLLQEEKMLEAIKLEELASVKYGIERGMIQGTIQKAIEIAKNLLDVLDVKTISLKTGLSIEEINKLKDEMKD